VKEIKEDNTRSNITIYKDGTPDQMKVWLWRTKRLFFPFSIPWRRFVAEAVWEIIDCAGFGLIAAFVMWLTAIIIGYMAMPFWNLMMIFFCIKYAHWALFLLTLDVQRSLHMEYIIEAMKNNGLSKEDMENLLEKSENK